MEGIKAHSELKPLSGLSMRDSVYRGLNPGIILPL
jgi:hypothetical protein